MAITGTRLACALAETKALTLTAASPGVVAGTMAKVEDVVGFYFKAADTGDSVAFIYYAPKVVVPCAAAASGSYAVGSKVYFDAVDADDSGIWVFEGSDQIEKGGFPAAGSAVDTAPHPFFEFKIDIAQHGQLGIAHLIGAADVFQFENIFVSITHSAMPWRGRGGRRGGRGAEPRRYTARRWRRR